MKRGQDGRYRTEVDYAMIRQAVHASLGKSDAPAVSTAAVVEELNDMGEDYSRRTVLSALNDLARDSEVERMDVSPTTFAWSLF